MEIRVRESGKVNAKIITLCGGGGALGGGEGSFKRC